jgi:hypothetical protein
MSLFQRLRQFDPRHEPSPSRLRAHASFFAPSTGLNGYAADIALGGAGAARAAETVHATATSARRWVAWVAALAKPGDLLAVVVRLDADAPAGAGLGGLPEGPTVRARAARVLAGLEQLGAALVRAGVVVAERTGLGRVLGWQHAAHGAVFGLGDSGLHPSPATVLGGGTRGS